MRTVLAHIAVDNPSLILVMVVAAVLVGPMLVARFAAGRPPELWRVLAAVFYGAIVFQILHLLEHLLQVGYWAFHPAESPWLTPWAVTGRDALAAVIDGHAATGNELLHLVGNLIFFFGIAAGVLVVHGRGTAATGGGWLRRALWVQGLHVVEHVALTITWLAIGQAHGLTTALGLLTPGTAVASGVRVWLHFLVNLAATAVAWAGLHQVRTSHRAAGLDKRPDRVLLQ